MLGFLPSNRVRRVRKRLRRELSFLHELDFHLLQAGVGVLQDDLPRLLARAAARETVVQCRERFAVQPALGKTGETMSEGTAQDGEERDPNPEHEDIHDAVGDEKTPKHHVVYHPFRSTFAGDERIVDHDARRRLREVALTDIPNLRKG